jgi:nitrate reductase NapE component
LAVSNAVKYEKIARIREVLFLAILLFPIFTAVTIIEGLINRYYLG